MNKLRDFLKDNIIVLAVVWFMITFLMQCSTNREMSKLAKVHKESVDSLQFEMGKFKNRLDSIPDHGQFEWMNKQLMYNFLIYEDDVDKGKTSLSSIKEKIEN